MPAGSESNHPDANDRPGIKDRSVHLPRQSNHTRPKFKCNTPNPGMRALDPEETGGGVAWRFAPAQPATPRPVRFASDSLRGAPLPVHLLGYRFHAGRRQMASFVPGKCARNTRFPA